MSFKENMHYCIVVRLKQYNSSFQSELLSIRECLVTKSAVISKLDEELLDNIEDENEIDSAEESQNFVIRKFL